MEIIFLGTSSGKTSLKRYHSSLILRKNDYNLLIDTGDSISRALLDSKIGFEEIDGILYSHFHADHFCGLPSLITQMKLEGREKDLSIYCYDKFKDLINSNLEANYLFQNSLGFNLEVIGFSTNEIIKFNDKFSATGKQNKHIWNKYSVETEVPFVSLSFLLKTGKKNIFYSSDIGSAQDLYLFADEKFDVFITEGTHISAEDILKAVKNLNPTKTVVTHFTDENEIELKKYFTDSDIEIAYDGKSIIID